MALTLGTDFVLYLRSDRKLTYTQIETALTDAGLDDVTINRNPSGDGYDLHLQIRSTPPGDPLDAVETYRALAEVIEALDAEPAPNEEPPAEEPPTE